MKYKEAINLVEKNVFNFKDLPIKFREEKSIALKAVKIDGYLEEFSLTREEADQLIMSARNIVLK